jgi:hypothetical protein
MRLIGKSVSNFCAIWLTKIWPFESVTFPCNVLRCLQDVEAIRFCGLDLGSSRRTTAFSLSIAILTQFVFVWLLRFVGRYRWFMQGWGRVLKFVWGVVGAQWWFCDWARTYPVNVSYFTFCWLIESCPGVQIDVHVVWGCFLQLSKLLICVQLSILGVLLVSLVSVRQQWRLDSPAGFMRPYMWVCVWCVWEFLMRVTVLSVHCDWLLELVVFSLCLSWLCVMLLFCWCVSTVW